MCKRVVHGNSVQVGHILEANQIKLGDLAWSSFKFWLEKEDQLHASSFGCVTKTWRGVQVWLKGEAIRKWWLPCVNLSCMLTSACVGHVAKPGSVQRQINRNWVCRLWDSAVEDRRVREKEKAAATAVFRVWDHVVIFVRMLVRCIL